ncbi:MCP four helix bundle domain-containing protein [Ramlibacter sp. USB13]|uniref:MCP four helix bundle domain-containing protein n=1 Tax=Ramlibacter cellulosilyticus TaxID=2764187 RepID=A0A923SBV5_9BURK|nr:methyl-accepting chemotaxis protein [Ramlibacter cellulosilyticus]MBC5783568.1 MCP four helix bundle domain-containing protein [Ramlibacter cellulosilyticus]
MRHLKVGVRLAVGFGLLLALMVAAVLVGLLGIRSAQEQATRLEQENIALLKATSAMQVAQLNQAVAIRDFVGMADVESQRAALRALRAGETAYAEALAVLTRLATDGSLGGELLAQASQLESASKRVNAKVSEALDLVDTAEYQQAQSVVYKEVRPLQAAIATQLRELAGRTHVLAQERATAARLEAQSNERRLALVLAAALLLGVGATVLITRGIVRPLADAVRTAERVADGDLTGHEVRAGRDETGRVLAALAGMQQALNGLVRSVRVGAEGVNHASARLSSGNAELAARTEEQAAALEEAAASVEELTASVKHNTGSALKGSELAREAAQLAGSGGTAVQDVMGTMAGIQKSARRVSDIVGMMDEIAFQTNLLALNAAVEAARAGDQGRGFAVVAAQVRVLAQRSAEAARDIKQLAHEAVGQADTGAKAAERASETMEKVVRVARDVAEVVSDIARASEEQRSGIEQVNTTVSQLETATQSNAGLVQEISTLTDALLSGARDLVAAANRFRLDAGEAHAGGFDDQAPVQEPPAVGWQETRPALT